MQARFLRLFVTSISSRGIKLVDTIFSYKDNHWHGVEVTATSVAGLFNGNKPEVSVLWRRYTRNYYELFLEVRITVKKLGEVHAKIQFRNNDGTISGLNPVVVLLGEATYLATITVLRDSGVGYGFSLKSEKTDIDDYVMSEDADHASLKKIGTRSVTQLVRRMIRTRLVEISLVNLLSNPWRNLCIPSVSDQCTPE
ncbi:hypothetical protein IscW_ISCW004666 [Ixodes scapularis]|uniref:Uncharacterized protein n=1 Tax=Ixodes scapularis TaxID=6945 RepID=B7PK26_IXOSC|nr:hypothetical protein IscW_ISCW004666 [Ixodes scapularis]|eukprot:XP_002409152.1 hypothetical protein IscW_ISCW004666 [Ixodes scapularis]